MSNPSPKTVADTRAKFLDESRAVVAETGNYTTEELQVGLLVIDPQVQRTAVNTGKVNRIVREFNADAVGQITVSRRPGSHHVILDGAHRVEALRRLTDNMGTVNAKVFHGLTLAEEARLFLDLNYGNQPSLFDKYRVGVVGEEPEYAAIDKIVHAAGFTVGPLGGNGTINAIAVLVRIFRLKYAWETPENPADHTILQLALAVIGDAWGNQEDGLKASSVEAIAKLIESYDPQLELDRLTSVLRSTEGGPGGLLGRAKGYASTRGIRVWQAFGQIVVDEYNKNLSKKSPRTLPPFASR
jgi:hypothetical protein